MSLTYDEEKDVFTFRIEMTGDALRKPLAEEFIIWAVREDIGKWLKERHPPQNK